MDSEILLVVDIGNTNIVVGGYLGDTLSFEFRLSSDSGRTVDEYEVLLSGLLTRAAGERQRYRGAIISSVVPAITPTFVSLLEQRHRITPKVVGPGIKTGIQVKVPDPISVGADRIVNAIAAKTLFGFPALVIDFGTATTFDYVSAAGAYEGGIITPGPVVAYESLVRNTAKLPRIELAVPRSIIGNTTVTAMQSGAVFGYLSLVEGLIARVINEVGPIPHVIATGGLGKLFSENTKAITHYDPHLTLKGMRMIYELNEAR